MLFLLIFVNFHLIAQESKIIFQAVIKITIKYKHFTAHLIENKNVVPFLAIFRTPKNMAYPKTFFTIDQNTGIPN